jgi:hypothetical protein
MLPRKVAPCVRQCLNSTQTRILRSDGSCGEKNRTLTIQHDERGALVSEPAQGCKGHGAISAYYNKPSQTVSDTRESRHVTSCADPIFDDEMSSIDAHGYAIPRQRENAATRRERS